MRKGLKLSLKERFNIWRIGRMVAKEPSIKDKKQDALLKQTSKAWKVVEKKGKNSPSK